MRVLLTNDDGIRAPGLAAMYAALLDRARVHGGPIGEVLAVAPLTVQSATSHGVTFHTPLMVSEERIDIGDETVIGVAVDGRPADCVKLALHSLWPDRFGRGSRPDLIISGMNSGANVGINVIYSGTVAAAIESAFLGVPSIAVSLHIGSALPRFDVGARHARRVIDRIIAAGMPSPNSVLSVNIPWMHDEHEHEPTPPTRVCPMNTHPHADIYERRVSPAGDVYYWSAAGGLAFRQTDADTDVHALFERRITVTPLRYDLTNPLEMEHWRRHLA